MQNKGWPVWLEIWEGNKRLVAAIFLSFLLHFLLYSGVHFPFFDFGNHASIIQASLSPLSPHPAIIQPQPMPEALPKEVEEVKASPQTELERKPEVEGQPKPLLEPEEASDGEQAQDTAEAPSSPAEVPVSEKTSAEPEDQEAGLVLPPVEEAALSQQGPVFVEMDYDVLRGANGSKLGETFVRYKSNEDGSYTLSSETKPSGLASLFLPKSLLMKSTGKVTPAGLQPWDYSYELEDKPEKNQYAHLHWLDSTLTMKTAKGEKTEDLPEGTQDFLSFMYQFMFSPPLEEMQLSLTNGKRLRTYEYYFEGEATVSTAVGELDTVHIVRENAEGDEKTELWLAKGYRYLPVKIRKTEKDGVIEQVVIRISADFLR